MKKIIILKKYLEVNKKFFIFMTGILLFSIFAGSVFSLTLNDSDTALVSEFLSNYFESISNNSVSIKNLIINSVLDNLVFTSIIFFLGFSVIGIPIIILLFFYKSFIIGFSIASILINYRLKGIILSILYVFPHQVIIILFLMVLVVYSLIMGIKIATAILKKGEISFRVMSQKYFNIFLITSFLIILCTLYETLIMPVIIRLFLTI